VSNKNFNVFLFSKDNIFSTIPTKIYFCYSKWQSNVHDLWYGTI